MSLLLRELVKNHNVIRQDRAILELVKAAHVVVVQSETPSLDAMMVYNAERTIVGTMVPGGTIKQPELPFAPPFPLCWIEQMTTDGGMFPIRLVECGHGSAGIPAHRVRLSGPVGAIVQETAPGVYDVHAVELNGDGPKDAEIGPSTMTARSLSLVTYEGLTNADFVDKDRPPIVVLLCEWLRMINEGMMAIEETDEVLMMPRGDGRKHKRKPHPIRRIVRIVPKAMRKRDVRPITAGGVLDWSHRWEVRGHWRHVRGLGKDRAGDYIVAGYTWVKDFVKGPQDKPLVVKTRELQQPQRVSP